MLVASCLPLLAQINNVLTVIPPEKIAGKRGEIAAADFNVQLKTGYHVNSNTPSDAYLIPLKLSWNAGPAEVQDVVFPAPKMEKYQFSSTPLSVFTGNFRIQTKFKILPNAPLGETTLTGKLRYQACNDQMCLPPRNVDVKLPVFVKN
jgi:hypothetical protein